LLVFKIAKLFLKISGERIKRPKKNLKKPIVVTCSSLYSDFKITAKKEPIKVDNIT
jgi:hypothetical protein